MEKKNFEILIILDQRNLYKSKDLFIQNLHQVLISENAYIDCDVYCKITKFDSNVEDFLKQNYKLKP